jgi:ubiquinone biosynthesis protein
VRRTLRLASVLGRHGLGWLLELAGLAWLVPFHRGLLGHARQARPYTAPEHVRMALEDLGPTFVKLGQLLSARADVLPPAYQTQLARLQDAAPSEPPGTVEEVIEAELKRPASEVFAWFDAAPLAAASIGQAHAARLVDGTEVVVKVRRPAAVARVEVDLAVLEWAAALASKCLVIARRLDVGGQVAELARTLRAELDYEIEAANAERFAADLASDPTVHVPAVHREASTARVITLTRIDGLRLSNLAALDAAGVDRQALARKIVDVVLAMVFEHGFFHADPHPGNLFVDPDGRLGLVDFGMVGVLDPPTRARLVRVFLATASGDATVLADEMLGLGTATEPVDRAALTHDLADLLAQVTSVPLGELRLGPLLQAELAIVRRHRLRLPPELALLVKTAAMTEGLAALLDPNFVLLSSFAPYAGRLTGPSTEAPPGRDGGRAPAPATTSETLPVRAALPWPVGGALATVSIAGAVLLILARRRRDPRSRPRPTGPVDP